MANEMDAMVAAAKQFRGGGVQGFRGTEAIGAQPRELTDTEARSQTIVGPVTFKLMDLRVAGLGVNPADPVNSPFIIAENEAYELSLTVEFNQTPLTELLMCLGTEIVVDFGIEGYGINAPEVNVRKIIKTVKGQYSYPIVREGIAGNDGLKPGLYEIGAVVTAGPVRNECTTKIWGHGYIKEVILQVYPAGQE